MPASHWCDSGGRSTRRRTTSSLGTSLCGVVILWRSKERSDAAQTIGSMPRPEHRFNGSEFCSAALYEGVTEWTLGSALRRFAPCSARG
ncbi:hypothetical protein EN943_10035 [Mesorhizobium sp. M7A.F.Ca.US.006.01.1.1]|nr:hypothetical protein EN943_10035 [Mesorhizobium sp. M7A.F.Ca.US.006.01.1.1]